MRRRRVYSEERFFRSLQKTTSPRPNLQNTREESENGVFLVAVLVRAAVGNRTHAAWVNQLEAESSRAPGVEVRRAGGGGRAQTLVCQVSKVGTVPQVHQAT